MIIQHKNALDVITKSNKDNLENSIQSAILEVATETGKSEKWVKRSLTAWKPALFPEFVLGVSKFYETGDTSWYVWCIGNSEGKESFLEMEKALEEHFHSNTSLSQKWVEEQISEKSLDRKLAAALKKTYKKEEFEDLRSHANYWLWQWAAIGQFDEWLKDHDSVKPSVLVEWLKQKMRTEVFARGKDALTRQNTGARTQYEISRGKVHDQSLQISADTPDVVLQQGEKEGDFEQHVVSMPVEVNIDPDFRGDFVRDLIRLARPRAADRYVRIFDLMAQDYSLDEIAEIEGVQKHRAAKLTQRVRDDIQQGAITTEVAKRILQEISDEPYSTRDDLLDVIPCDKKESFGAALEILSYRKMISENKQGCFLATKEGEFSLYSGELF